MGIRKKTLMFMYIADAHGFCGQGFHFSTDMRFRVRTEEKKAGLVLEVNRVGEKLPDAFWGENISGVSLFVGENGSGKTTVMQMICQWVCMLSQMKMPREKGILVFREGNSLRYAAFAEGTQMELTVDIPRNTVEMMLLKEQDFPVFFEGVRLVYYSNTLTELNLDEYKILQDDSMSQRIKTANADGHAMGSDIMANFKWQEFDRQIAAALETEDFEIEYILMEISLYSVEQFEGLLPDDMEDIRGELKDFLKCGRKRSDLVEATEEDIAYMFLGAFFEGILINLLKWGRIYRNSEGKSIVKDKFVCLVKNGRPLRGEFRFCQYAEWIRVFLIDLLSDCKNAYEQTIYKEKFKDYWESRCNQIINFIEFLKKGNQPKKNQFFMAWKCTEGQISAKKVIWKINLKEKRKVFGEFWNIYKELAPRTENIYLRWDASSGQQNWAGVFSALKMAEKPAGNVWYFLDEPDNTFHPEWQRKLVSEILKALQGGESRKQVILSTHSPIMLSDVPEPAVIYLKKDEAGNKEVVEKATATFGQNIYVLFNDAFFLRDGVIGAFASEKITEAVVGLEKIEKKLYHTGGQSLDDGESEEIDERIERYGQTADLVAEPVFGNQLRHYVKNCKRLRDREKRDDKDQHNR